MIGVVTKILVVDDEPEVARVLEAQIDHMRMGLAVYCVYSGEEALRALRDSDFDIVLMDYSMPGKNGIEVLREIKKEHPRTNVIMVSGAPPPGAVDEALRLGAIAFLEKPIAPDELERAIGEALGSVSSSRREKRIECESCD